MKESSIYLTGWCNDLKILRVVGLPYFLDFKVCNLLACLGNIGSKLPLANFTEKSKNVWKDNHA
jgi:hypothetical protein